MGNGDVHPWTRGQDEVMHSIAHSLRTIAGCMEAQELRAREKPKVDPDSLGMLEITTPEDIAAMAAKEQRDG